MNQELFLRRRSKVHVPVGTGGATRAQVASAVREVTAFRCVLSESLIEQIGKLSATELKYWLREIVGVLRRETGAHVHHRPFYPGFPEQVMTASGSRRNTSLLYSRINQATSAVSSSESEVRDETSGPSSDSNSETLPGSITRDMKLPSSIAGRACSVGGNRQSVR